MPDQSSTPLLATVRTPSGSRSARRLRREGLVPGVVYGGGQEPVAFQVGGRELRRALSDAGAVIDLKLDGGSAGPVVLKELIRHPVSGAMTHIDLLRVRLDVAIQSQVTIELTGAEDAQGVKVGGILEQPLREVTVEALPNDIPDTIRHDVNEMDIGDTLTVSALVAPQGVTILTEPDTLVAALSASRMARDVAADIEIETETELVGEAEADAEVEAEGDAEGGDSE